MSNKQQRISDLIELANAIGKPCDALTKDSPEVISHIVFSVERRNSFIEHIERMLNREGIGAIPANSKTT